MIDKILEITSSGDTKESIRFRLKEFLNSELREKGFSLMESKLRNAVESSQVLLWDLKKIRDKINIKDFIL